MSFKIISKKALPKSQYEIEGEITAEAVNSFKPEAIRKFSNSVQLDGFRPGHVPEKVLIEKLGEVVILEEAGRLALEKHYTDIVTTADIHPIGNPNVNITKLAPENPLGFKIITAVLPIVEIKDYKRAAKEIMSEKTEVKVEEKELSDAIEELRKNVAHSEFHKSNGDTDNHEHGELELPEVDAEFIKKFGDFKTVEEFKAKITESLKAEKEYKARDKKRLTLVEKIIENTEVEVPEVLTESELNKMLNEMRENISQMGLSMEDYLKHLGKSEDDIKKEWTPEAEKRAKIQLILNHITVKEGLKVSEEDINKEVEQMKKYYKDIDPVKAFVYIETMLLNEKAWVFLEEQGK